MRKTLSEKATAYVSSHPVKTHIPMDNQRICDFMSGYEQALAEMNMSIQGEVESNKEDKIDRIIELLEAIARNTCNIPRGDYA